VRTQLEALARDEAVDIAADLAVRHMAHCHREQIQGPRRHFSCSRGVLSGRDSRMKRLPAVALNGLSAGEEEGGAPGW